MSATILHTWQPISLTDAEAQPPEPPNISGVIYPERTHVWSGEPETLKSMVALALKLEQIRQGRYCAYIDYENGIRETVSRLRALGATDEDLAMLLYYQPDEPMTEDIRPDVLQLFADAQPAFVTIDSYTGSLALHGFDPNKSVDVENHHKVVIHPLRACGAGVILLDHLVKNRENRGRYSIGSERKIGVCDVHISFDTILPLSRGHKGVVKLVTHKDRPGYLHRPKAAQITFHSSPVDGGLTWDIQHGEDQEQPSAPFRPTVLMERVSRHLEQQEDGLSLTRIEEDVLGKADYLRRATEQLVKEGYAAETTGPRKARLIVSVVAYRENNDPHAVLPEQTKVRHDPVPDPVPSQSPTPSPTPSRPEWLKQTDSATPSHPVPTPSQSHEPTPSPGALSPTGGAPGSGRGHAGTETNGNQPESSYWDVLFQSEPEPDTD